MEEVKDDKAQKTINKPQAKVAEEEVKQAPPKQQKPEGSHRTVINTLAHKEDNKNAPRSNTGKKGNKGRGGKAGGDHNNKNGDQDLKGGQNTNNNQKKGGNNQNKQQ